jgi:hypothetical protein
MPTPISYVAVTMLLALPGSLYAQMNTPTPGRLRPASVQRPISAAETKRPVPRPTPPPGRPGSSSLSIAPAAPERSNSRLPLEETKGPAKPVNMGVDLSIQKATQTSGDFWIVRIKNSGAAEAPPSSLRVLYEINYTSGNFPNGVVGQYSYPTPMIKPGGVVDINVKTSKRTTPEIQAHFEVNANQAIKELNYSNNKKTVPANPAYE